MLTEPSPSIAAAVHQCLRVARARVGDPLARAGLLCSSRTTGEQLARDLVRVGGLLNVDILTPSQVVSDIGRLGLSGLRPEPPGWLGALLSARLPTLPLGAHTETLRRPGWRGPLSDAIRELEEAGATAAVLDAIAAGGDADLSDRCGVLRTLLAEVAAARLAEGRHGQRALDQAALDLLRAGGAHPYDDVRVVVVVGDSMLAPVAHAALGAWLARCDVQRVAVSPLTRLPSAVHGLWSAAPDAPVAPVLAPPTALGHLHRHVFGPPAGAAPADGTVVLAETADEVRELGAAVDEVMAAVRDGTPLDQIAIVLPDAEQADVLAEALDRAGLPATWLTAEPIRRTPAARFLSLALRVAEGDASPARWHQLITQPGVIGLEWNGRQRWRRLLASAPPSAHGDSAAVISGHLAALTDGDDEHQKAAAAALQQNLQRLRAALGALPVAGSLADHGQAWAGLMERFFHRSRDRAQVLKILRSWGGGPRVQRADAAALLDDQLRGTPNLRGSLSQRSIRVLPPMLALGGSYALLCVTGVTEGRLPRQVRDGGLLSPALRAALRSRGVPVIDRAAREAVEQRRMAAVIAGCRGTLWLSVPRTELLKARPQLPSALVRVVGVALAGRRQTLSDLRRQMVSCGRRSAPAPTAARASGRSAFRLARAAHAPAAHLADLMAHPTVRRLAALNRSIDRLLYEGAPPDAWTGLVAPDILAAPVQGEALSPRALARLVCEPSDYFLRDLLGGYTASGLRSGALSARDLRRVVLALVGHDGSRAGFSSNLEARLGAWQAAGGLDGEQVAALRAEGLRHFETLRSLGATDAVATTAVAGAPVGPFSVQVTEALRSGEALLERRSYAKATKLSAAQADGFALLAQGFALSASGEPLSAIRQVGLNGKVREARLSRHRDDFIEAAEAGAARAAAGYWPTTTAGSRLSLARERTEGAALPLAQLMARLAGRGDA